MNGSTYRNLALAHGERRTFEKLVEKKLEKLTTQLVFVSKWQQSRRMAQDWSFTI